MKTTTRTRSNGTADHGNPGSVLLADMIDGTNPVANGHATGDVRLIWHSARWPEVQASFGAFAGAIQPKSRINGRDRQALLERALGAVRELRGELEEYVRGQGLTDLLVQVATLRQHGTVLNARWEGRLVVTPGQVQKVLRRIQAVLGIIYRAQR